MSIPVKIGVERRFTIPSEFMEELGWKVGDLVIFEKAFNVIIIKRVRLVPDD